MKVLVTALALALAMLATSTATHAKTIAEFMGSNARNMWPVELTNEPCRDGHPEIPGKRAVIITPRIILEACWNVESGGNSTNAVVAVCQKQGGRRDGQVMVGYGTCYDIPKMYFVNPDTMPKPAFSDSAQPSPAQYGSPTRGIITRSVVSSCHPHGNECIPLSVGTKVIIDIHNDGHGGSWVYLDKPFAGQTPHDLWVPRDDVAER